MWFSLAGAYDPAIVQIGFNQSVDNEQGCISNHAHRPPAFPVRVRVGFADVHGIIKNKFGEFKRNAVLFIVTRRFGVTITLSPGRVVRLSHGGVGAYSDTR